jgi:lipopolysaccharide export LptBFGC system permease protein LptF
MFGRVFEEIAKGSQGWVSTFMVWLPNLIFFIIAAYLYRKAPK